MKLIAITKNPRVYSWVNKQISYFSQDLYSIKNDTFEMSGEITPIVIVARHHYEESWQTYPAVSRKELSEILKLKKGGDRQVTKIYSNDEQDGFDVKTISFKLSEFLDIANASCLIPETELFLANIVDSNPSSFELATPFNTLFLAKSGQKVSSLYKKGLMQSIQGFLCAAGVSQNSSVQTIEESNYARQLLSNFNSVPLSKLFQISDVGVSKLLPPMELHKLYWAPLATAMLVTLGANLFYYIQEYRHEHVIESSIKDTAAILAKKKAIDEVNRLVNVINSEISSNELTHYYWDILDTATKSGMHVSRFRLDQKGLEIRGLADKASTVLSELSKLPQVKKADFEGSIQKSRGKDLFTLMLIVESVDNA